MSDTPAPQDLMALIAELRALPSLDPVRRVERASELLDAARPVLADVRAHAIAQAAAFGMTDTNMAAELGVSKQRVGQLRGDRRLEFTAEFSTRDVRRGQAHLRIFLIDPDNPRIDHGQDHEVIGRTVEANREEWDTGIHDLDQVRADVDTALGRLGFRRSSGTEWTPDECDPTTFEAPVERTPGQQIQRLPRHMAWVNTLGLAVADRRRARGSTPRG